MNNVREIAQKFKTDSSFVVFENEPMASRFSFKVGGTAALLIEPLSEDAFLQCVTSLLQSGIPYFVLGGGTNIVFPDGEFSGAVVSTGRLNKIEEASSDGNTVVLKCQCGVSMNALVNYSVKKCCTGLETFCGLPGTVGGACYMNARCFDREVSDAVKNIVYLKKENSVAGGSAYKKEVMPFDKTMWGYKKSPFTGTDDIVLSAEFVVTQENAQCAERIAGTAKKYMQERIEKGHFNFPCAGSVFKNSREFGKPTGQIIDELGLKGYKIGGAQIAPWHGNIIINKKNATQRDIRQLVDFIKGRAKEKFGFDLEEEIIFK